MLPSQFFVRCFSLLIVVEMKESFGQLSSINEISEELVQESTFKSGNSEIADQILSQNKILEKLAESIQTMQAQMNNLSQEVESKLESVQLGYSELRSEIEQLRNLTTNSSLEVKSNIKNLSREVESNRKSLSREVESKLESVQLGYSELRSEIKQLRNLTTNSSLEVKSSIKNLSREVESNRKSLSREVESKLESVQLQFSKLKSESKASMMNLSREVGSSLKNLSREVEYKLESVQLRCSELTPECKSSMKNLSQVVKSNRESLSREVESKLESVQLGYSELRSDIEQLRYLTTDCSSDRTTETTVCDARLCPRPEKAATVAFPPQCCSFPFTFQDQLHHRCIPGAGGNFVQCLIEQRIWVTCAEPNDYVAHNQSINTTIPFVGQFTAIHVHNWIVFQQRIDGSVSFNRSWEEYKAGFGKHDGNFWMGLEKVHKMTNSAPHKLRMEFMLRNGSWYSVEYDTFRVESEASNYKIHVAGYSGDVDDVMNYGTIAGGKFNNGMNFSTYDRDNDRYSGNCASYYGGGWWYNACYRINLNGLDGSYFNVGGLGRCSVSRMMMKKV